MGRREEFSVGQLIMVGISTLLTTHTVTVLARDSAGNVLLCTGADVPHDNDVGFAKGCIFISTAAGTFYTNVGTALLANFDVQGTVAAGTVTHAMLAADAVETDNLKDANVTTAKLAVPKLVALSSGVKDHTDFTDNAGTATGFVDFADQLPVGAIVLGWKADVTEGFAGDTTAVIQVGKAGALDDYSDVTTGSVFAIGTAGAACKAAKSYIAALTTPRVTVTGAADFSSISAGKIEVTIYYIATV